MCNPLGPYKLCTCSEKIDKKWKEDEPFGALVVYKYKKRLKGEIKRAKEY